MKITLSDEKKKELVKYYEYPYSTDDIKLTSIEDICRYPNCTVFSNFLNYCDAPMDTLLSNFQVLESKMKYFLDSQEEVELVKEFCSDILEEIEIFTRIPRALSSDETFCCVFSKMFDVYALIISDISEGNAFLPNGKQITFNILSNEYSANMEILDAAFGYVNIGGVYLRGRHIEFMKSYATIAAEQYNISSSSLAAFTEAIPLILYGHEYCEIKETQKNPAFYNNPEKELLTEEMSMKFLESSGFDMEMYKLYTKLTKVEDARGKNLSQLVWDNLL